MAVAKRMLVSSVLVVVVLQCTVYARARGERVVDRIDREVSDLKDSLRKIQDTLDDILYRNELIEEAVNKFRHSYSFYARLSDNREIRFEPDEPKHTDKEEETEKKRHAEPHHEEHNENPIPILIFDKMITNKGDAYDNYTGYFTAPVTGQYLFTVNIAPIGRDNRSFRLNLMLDNTTVLYAKKHDNDYHANLRLVQGQRVWLEVPRITGLTKAFGRYGKYTSFSGMLLAGEYEGEPLDYYYSNTYE